MKLCDVAVKEMKDKWQHALLHANKANQRHLLISHCRRLNPKSGGVYMAEVSSLVCRICILA